MQHCDFWDFWNIIYTTFPTTVQNCSFCGISWTSIYMVGGLLCTIGKLFCEMFTCLFSNQTIFLKIRNEKRRVNIRMYYSLNLRWSRSRNNYLNSSISIEDSNLKNIYYTVYKKQLRWNFIIIGLQRGLSLWDTRMYLWAKELWNVRSALLGRVMWCLATTLQNYLSWVTSWKK